MGETPDGLWWIMVVITGAVSPGMLLYGIRQKAPLPLIFGVVIGVVPMLTGTGWLAALITVALFAGFFVARKYL